MADYGTDTDEETLWNAPREKLVDCIILLVEHIEDLELEIFEIRDNGLYDASTPRRN